MRLRNFSFKISKLQLYKNQEKLPQSIRKVEVSHNTIVFFSRDVIYGLEIE